MKDLVKSSKYIKYQNFINNYVLTEVEDKLVHTHHITPKCIGGSNRKNNIIRLSIEDHAIAHSILEQYNIMPVDTISACLFGLNRVMINKSKYKNYTFTAIVDMHIQVITEYGVENRHIKIN